MELGPPLFYSKKVMAIDQVGTIPSFLCDLTQLFWGFPIFGTGQLYNITKHTPKVCLDASQKSILVFATWKLKSWMVRDKLIVF